jgi:septum formation protein
MNLRMAPEKLAIFLSEEKARATCDNVSDAIIIAADTFIVHKRTMLGKPYTSKNACATLSKISGKKIGVISGLTVLHTPTMTRHQKSVQTHVFLKDLSEIVIRKYISSGESLECAGAFNIFGKGRELIKKVDGSYTNVMGLPMEELADILSIYGIRPKHNIETWLRNELQI